MTTYSTSLGAWLLAIKMTLDNHEIETEELFRELGIEAKQLNSPDCRVPLNKTFEVWKYAVNKTRNPAFGLEVARNVKQTTFHALGFAVMASPSLEDAFSRITRYFRVVADATELSFERKDNVYCFKINKLATDNYVSDESIDAMMAVIFRTCYFLSNRDLKPIKVSFTRRMDESHQHFFQKVFRAQVNFDTTDNAMYFHAEDIERELPFSNADLAKHNDEVLSKLIASYEKSIVRIKLERIFSEELCHGEPSQVEAAKKMGVSVRNLQRKLSEENTTYREVLSNTRKELAKSYLSNPRYSISEVAYLLGFSSTSSFNRMIRDWVGKTPSEYRDSLQLKD